MGDFTQRPPVVISYRAGSGATAPSIPAALRGAVAASGLLSIFVPLDYTVSIAKTPISTSPYSVLVTYDGSPSERSVTLIECYLERDAAGSYDFLVFSFFLDPSCRPHMAAIRAALKAGTPPRTVGGWGMQVVGAIARFLAAELRLPTLTISLYDTWGIKTADTGDTITSSVLKRDERVRTQYARIRHARLDVDEDALNRRLARGGFYATWGFEPESESRQKDMHAVVSPDHPALETLLETRSCID